MLRLFQLVFAIPVLLACAARAEAADDTIRIVYNNAWPPYSSQSGNSAVGILPDLMDELLANRLQLTVEHISYPWKRAQTLVWSGEADAMVTVPTEERRRLGLIGSESAIQLRLQPIIADGATELESEMVRLGSAFDWHGRRFCHDAGSGWHRSYAAAQGLEPFVARTVDACVRMIAAGRVDGTVQVSAVARSAVRNLKQDSRAIVVDATIEEWDFHLILRPDFPDGESLMSRLDALLRDLRTSGELEDIWARIEDRNIRN